MVSPATPPAERQPSLTVGLLLGKAVVLFAAFAETFAFLCVEIALRSLLNLTGAIPLESGLCGQLSQRKGCEGSRKGRKEFHMKLNQDPGPLPTVMANV